MADIRVADLLLDLERGAGGERTRLEAAANERSDLIEARDAGTPDHPLGLRAGRDDVGGIAALGHDAVDAVGGTQLLAQQGDRGLGHDERVGGIDAEVREAGGVRLLARVRHVQGADRDDRGGRLVLGPRVDHHRGVDAVELAGLEEADLATPGLLGGRAHDGDPQAQLVRHDREREAGTHAGGRDHVVTAGMPDCGQRVVLDAHGDVEGTRAVAAHDRRGHAGHTGADVEAGGGEPLGDPPGCQDLLVAELGVGMDPVAEADQRGMRLLEEVPSDLLRVRPVHVRPFRSSVAGAGVTTRTTGEVGAAD